MKRIFYIKGKSSKISFERKFCLRIEFIVNRLRSKMTALEQDSRISTFVTSNENAIFNS